MPSLIRWPRTSRCWKRGPKSRASKGDASAIRCDLVRPPSAALATPVRTRAEGRVVGEPPVFLSNHAEKSPYHEDTGIPDLTAATLCSWHWVGLAQARTGSPPMHRNANSADLQLSDGAACRRVRFPAARARCSRCRRANRRAERAVWFPSRAIRPGTIRPPARLPAGCCHPVAAVPAFDPRPCRQAMKPQCRIRAVTLVSR